MGDAPAMDARSTWIMQKVTTLLKSKDELFLKLLGTEEGEVIRRFIDGDSPTLLYFAGGAKEFVVMETLPAGFRKKACFVLKTAEKLGADKDIETLHERCVVGDINAGVLESMSGVLRNVYLPIFSNPKNTGGWPEVAFSSKMTFL